MIHLPVFFGTWIVREDNSWHFEIEKSKGGRVFLLHHGVTHAELVQMVKEDYCPDMEDTMLDLSYSLPEVMLAHMPSGTPPMVIRNDRAVGSLLELCRQHVVRLCVSAVVREKTTVDYAAGSDDEYHGSDEPVSDAGDRAGIAATKAEEDDSDVDYCGYGKVDDSDDDDEYDSDFGVDVADEGASNVIGKWVDQVRVGQAFSSKKEVEEELRTTALMQKFPLKIFKSNKHRVVATCRVKGCTWRLRAEVKNEPDVFWVTKYVKTHTCSVADRDMGRTYSTPKHIAKTFVAHFGTIDGVLPHHIRDSMRTLFKMKIGYTTSYRALISAQELVRGSAESGYGNLPSYLHQLGKVNPGTVSDLVCDEKGCFKYMFLAFGASIAGFQYLRRVVVVDGTHLTGKYDGTLLVAAGQDANFQIFPLAFGIVDVEDDPSWNWFFTNLAKCFSHEHALTIVSDRHQSIANACASVLPWATRGICYYHMQQNIVSKYKAKDIMHMVKRAAYAYTLVDFNRHMDDINRVHPALAEYLNEADPRLWSRVHFPGDRYNIKTSNIAESLNSALKKAKGFPISFMLEYIREKLTRWFYKRREDALSLKTTHSRGVETLLAIRADYARAMMAHRIDTWRFEIRDRKHRYLVDLERVTCSCGLTVVEKIPCSHIISAAADAKVNYSTYVSPIYGKDYLYATYGQCIYPVDGELGTGPFRVRPPTIRRGPGRRKLSRWQTFLELSRKRGKNKPRTRTKHYNCSKCKQPGHTKPYCVSKDQPTGD